MILDYKSELRRVFEQLGESKLIVLATSHEDKPTARIMSCVMYDNKIAFQTSKEFVKYKQMVANKRVALCVDNLQIEGIAHEMGHPFEEQNEKFKNMYRIHHRSSYDTYTHMEQDVVIEVIPSFITVWGYEDGEPYRLFINILEETAYKEMYDHSK